MNSLRDQLNFSINPREISKTIKKIHKVNNDILQEKKFFEYFIVGGDWDLDFNLFKDERNFIEMKELFNFRSRFRESNSYRKCLEELNNGIPQKGYDGIHFQSVEDVDATFEFYLNLIHEMKKNGYVAQDDLVSDKIDNEIGVAISSSSELFHFRTGHHRLAISKLLDLPEVRVVVHLVHDNWITGNLQQSRSSTKDDILGKIHEKVRKIDEQTSSR